MAGVALVLYVIFLVLAFGVRGWRQYRRTGSTGFRGLRPGAGAAEWLGGVLFVLAVLTGLAAPVAQLAGLAPLVDSTPVHLAGLGLALAGIAATLLAQGTMGTSWRLGVDPTERTAQVTTGPFTSVRNPIFTAMLTAALGLTLLAPNPLALAGLAALAAAVQVQVRAVEEPYLVHTHGENYRAYAARAGRFVPRLGRLA